MTEGSFYLTISKVAIKLNVQPHVLRFWEKKFTFINPKKGVGGRRYYSPSDIESLLLIKNLLHKEGFTIKGAINFMNIKYKKKSNVLIVNELLTSKSYTDLDEAINLIKEGNKLLDKHLYK